jgi:hypothetical protein
MALAGTLFGQPGSSGAIVQMFFFPHIDELAQKSVEALSGGSRIFQPGLGAFFQADCGHRRSFHRSFFCFNTGSCRNPDYSQGPPHGRGRLTFKLERKKYTLDPWFPPAGPGVEEAERLCVLSWLNWRYEWRQRPGRSLRGPTGLIAVPRLALKLISSFM